MIRLGLHNGFKVIKECNYSCRTAKAPLCECICGGVNHGTALREDLTDVDREALDFLAAMNAQKYADALGDEFMGIKERSNFRVVVGITAEQLDLGF